MKKNLKKVLLAVIIAVCGVCCVLFAACGDSGTYKFSSFSYTSGDATVTVNAGEEYNGVTITRDYMTITLNDDGTGVMTQSREGVTTSIDITWTKSEEKENVYILTSAGIGFSLEATISGNTLTCEYGNGTMTLTK